MNLHAPLAALLAAVALTAAAPARADDADFQRRCSAPGVLRCIGFDRNEDAAQNVTLFKSGDGRFLGSIDSSVKASGAGSLRFEIPSNTGENSSGYWLGDLGAAFGENSRFYVQWRQRFSQTMVSTRFSGGGWKQIILHRDGPSCASVQVVLQNVYHRGVVQGYSNCGAAAFTVTQPDGDTLLQQGDYNCLRRSLRPDDCAEYAAEQWMTFYLDIKVGTFGQPNSSVQGYVAYEGQPLRKFIDQPAWRFNFDRASTDTFRKVQLTPYNTNKKRDFAHPTAFTWYDELIVSRQPIAGPDGQPATGAGDTLPPAPPSNVSFSP